MYATHMCIVYCHIGKPSDNTTYVYPAMISISVDLPAPEGPMMAVSSPLWNSPLTLFKMHFDSEMYKYLQKSFSCSYEKITIVERISLILVCSNFLLPQLRMMEFGNKTWIQKNGTSAHRLLLVVQHCQS